LLRSNERLPEEITLAGIKAVIATFVVYLCFNWEISCQVIISRCLIDYYYYNNNNNKNKNKNKNNVNDNDNDSDNDNDNDNDTDIDNDNNNK